MAINEISYASKWAGELDKMYVQKSATGFLADNVLRAKFVGARTVVIPDIDFEGLVDYDRDGGFSGSSMSVSNETHQLKMDRARSISIDREDLDETGIANLAGQVLGEFVRTKVVPETDAYVISELTKKAIANSQTVEWSDETPYKLFSDIVARVQDAAGYDEELVCFVDKTAYHALKNSDEFTRHIEVSDFKQGDINLKVKSVDGVSIIPVSSERMKSDYDFKNISDGADENNMTGGFKAAEGASDVHMLILPKKAASLVKKTEKLRVFSPEQNPEADAYKFDYRIYYDLLVKKSGIKGIWAAL